MESKRSIYQNIALRQRSRKRKQYPKQRKQTGSPVQECLFRQPDGRQGSIPIRFRNSILSCGKLTKVLMEM